MASGGDRDFALVAAIDFGTTFSGYAFSFVGTKENPDLPEKIRTNTNWGASLGFQSFKAPTCVLTNRSGEFLAFGYDAEKKYSEAHEDEDVEPDMLLFRHFKMMLNNREKVKLTATISSIDGTITPALDIFAHAIRYLKDHLLDAIKTESVRKLTPSLVRWVITVPAIWSDGSKQFMREAAYRAGCIGTRDSKQLVIALEPEAASLLCRRLNMAHYTHGTDVSFPTGTKYVVLDCGGGTTDITAHVTQVDKKVKELLHASGGSWGGTRVDANFVDFIESILGKNFLNTYRQKCPQEWLNFLTSFERIKKSFGHEGETKISIPIPWSMGDLYTSTNKGKSIKQAINTAASKGVSFNQGILHIKYDAAKSFFDPIVKEIVEHTRKLIRDPKLHGLNYMLMVGGFSECKVLQQAITDAFGGNGLNGLNGLNVLIPGEAQLAVLKGAVLYGHSPADITARIARMTYSCQAGRMFDATKHDASRKYRDEDGYDRCHVFRTIVEQGTEILIGKKITHTFTLSNKQTEVALPLFCTCSKITTDVMYTDEPDMQALGSVQIEHLGTGAGREVELSLQFGCTEIEVEAVDVTTGKRASTVIDFLTT